MDKRRDEIQSTKENLKEKDYYTDVKTFMKNTVHYTSRLPIQWQHSIIDPIISSVVEITTFTVQANKIYVNPKDFDYKINLHKRIELLSNALLLFAKFDVAIEILECCTHLEEGDYKQLDRCFKGILQRYAEAEDTKDAVAEINFTHPKGVFVRTSFSEDDFVRFKLTTRNMHNLIDSEIVAKDVITRRLSSDRALYKKLLEQETKNNNTNTIKTNQ